MYLIGMKVYFDKTTGRLFSPEDELILGENAKECLSLLLENNGELVTKDEIVKRVWTSKGVVVSDNAVRQTMHILRRALNQFSPERQLITTVPRNGYMITQARIVENSDESLLLMQRKTVRLPLWVKALYAFLIKTLWPGRKGFVFAILSTTITCAMYASWHDQTYHSTDVVHKSPVTYQYHDKRMPQDFKPDNSEITEAAAYELSEHSSESGEE